MQAECRCDLNAAYSAYLALLCKQASGSDAVLLARRLRNGWPRLSRAAQLPTCTYRLSVRDKISGIRLKFDFIGTLIAFCAAGSGGRNGQLVCGTIAALAFEHRKMMKSGLLHCRMV